MDKFQIINQTLLNDVITQAKQSPRLRKNYNFHLCNEDKSHRLLNAIEPGSYVVPHRHLDPNKDETLIVLTGRLGVIVFADNGEIQHRIELSPAGENSGINFIHGCYHSVLALESNTVFLDTKAGPYEAVKSAELAPWAPKEDERAAMNYYQKLRELFVS